MKTFYLQRDIDISGVSGTGIVAEGCQFNDNSVVLHWLGDHSSINIYHSIKDLEAIHGHNGNSRIVWSK